MSIAKTGLRCFQVYTKLVLRRVREIYISSGYTKYPEYTEHTGELHTKQHDKHVRYSLRTTYNLLLETCNIEQTGPGIWI